MTGTLTKLLEVVLPASLEFEAVLPAFLEVFNTFLKLRKLKRRPVSDRIKGSAEDYLAGPVSINTIVIVLE